MFLLAKRDFTKELSLARANFRYDVFQLFEDYFFALSSTWGVWFMKASPSFELNVAD